MCFTKIFVMKLEKKSFFGYLLFNLIVSGVSGNVVLVRVFANELQK